MTQLTNSRKQKLPGLLTARKFSRLSLIHLVALPPTTYSAQLHLIKPRKTLRQFIKILLISGSSSVKIRKKLKLHLLNQTYSHSRKNISESFPGHRMTAKFFTKHQHQQPCQSFKSRA